MAAHERKAVIERMDSFPKQSVKQTSMERKRSLPGEKRRICYTWKTTGMCRLGSLCRYAHDEELAYVPPDYTHRKWSNAQASTSSPQEPFGCDGEWNFTVMSYNVLADELAILHAKELYLAVPEGCLPWRKRVIKLVNELLHWKPDIMCLQEIDHPEDFISVLKPLGYSFEFVGRTGGRRDGCLTLWQTDKFQAIAWDRVRMCHHNLRDNVGLIVVLRAIGADSSVQGPALAVANTHLLFNPRRGDVKLGQVGLILRKVAAICKDIGTDSLVIFSGDFNSTPQSGICSFIRTGELDCFLEDRRTLSGQLEASKVWAPQGVAQRAINQSEPDPRRRGASLDNSWRSYRTCLGLQMVAPSRQLPPLPQDLPPLLQSGTPPLTAALPPTSPPLAPSPLKEVAAVEIVMKKGALGRLHHSSSFTNTESLVGVRDARHSGPVFGPGQQPLYPYTDQFGQTVWSHIPPSDAVIKRQPFYHEPMVVEEAKPPPPPPPPSGIFRTVSFAKRQANAETWTTEQLMTATGYVPPEAGRPAGSEWGRHRSNTPNVNDVWIAEHPLPMQSTYEAVLGTEPAYTSCHSKFIGTVDYVWFTPQAGQLRLTPTNVLLPPPIESLHCGLPSPDWPSDHISLLAHFTISVGALSTAVAGAPTSAEEPEASQEAPSPGVRGNEATHRVATPDLGHLQMAVDQGILPQIVVAELHQRFTA